MSEIEFVNADRAWKCVNCGMRHPEPDIDLADALCRCGVGKGRWAVVTVPMVPSPPYLDRILGIYAPDVPGVREALTAIVEGEIAERAEAVSSGLRDRAERAEAALTDAEAHVESLSRDCRQLEADREYNAGLVAERDERLTRAEADAATLREQLKALCRHKVHVQRENNDPLSPIQYVACPPCADGGWVRWIDLLAALTSGGQG